MGSRFLNEFGVGDGEVYETPENGTFEVKWSNGKTRYKWDYKDGKRADGKSKSWHENGELKQDIEWKNGLREGSHVSYHDNGEKESEATLLNGQPHGLYTVWDKDGNKINESRFVNGTHHGVRTQWHSNGQKKLECESDMGKQVGKILLRNENGDEING